MLYRYATFNELEVCISTDFSAQYAHKASDTRTCEHPGRSNMDVFVVTHSPTVVDGQRQVTTDIWRIFSEAKGSSLFHNQGLDDIVKYYLGALTAKLRRVYVFSDGCRSQYKGKKNFVRVAQFPSRMRGVHLVHRFAASHHFKGPHDAYGKDAKVLCRTAERNQKARLASTHDVYYFCATKLPAPRRGSVTAQSIVESLPAASPLPPRTPARGIAAAFYAAWRLRQQRAAALALAEATTNEAASAIAARLAEAGIEVEVPWVVEEEGAEAEDEDEDEAECEAEAEAEAEGEGEREGKEEAVQAAAQAKEAAAAAAAAELDVEAEEEVGDDFLFDESGARIGRDDCCEEPSGEADDVEMEAEVAVGEKRAPAMSTALPKRARAPRKLQIFTQAPGTEAGSEGVMRTVEQQARRPGLFSASRYFWLYYAAAGVPGLTDKVEVGTLAERGQYHAILDDSVDMDADSIAGSNSTYEFAGVDAARPELLYTRIYPCVCRRCRDPDLPVREDYSDCPHMTTVGKFMQQTIHEATGVTKQRQVQRGKAEVFGRGIKCDSLYAAYASHDERGARKYWLLKVVKRPYKTKKATKVTGGSTIKTGTLVVNAQWYQSTSDAQDRKSYTLVVNETVTVPVASLVQEHDLEWQRVWRAPGAEHIISDESHLQLMCHNYSNTK